MRRVAEDRETHGKKNIIFMPWINANGRGRHFKRLIYALLEIL
jgi:hypothetical protein